MAVLIANRKSAEDESFLCGYNDKTAEAVLKDLTVDNSRIMNEIQSQCEPWPR